MICGTAPAPSDGVGVGKVPPPVMGTSIGIGPDEELGAMATGIV